MFYNILQHAHSGLRWLVLISIILAIVAALTQWNRASQNGKQLRFASIALRITHLQLLVGLVIYFISPKVQFAGDIMGNAVTRFYTVEHLLMMIIAIALITVGYSRAKRLTSTSGKAKTVFWFYLIGLVIMLASIPWPFREALGGSWG